MSKCDISFWDFVFDIPKLNQNTLISHNVILNTKTLLPKSRLIIIQCKDFTLTYIFLIVDIDPEVCRCQGTRITARD